MAILNQPPQTPSPQGNDRGDTSITLVRKYMFRQYWSMKWILLSLVSFMSIYTINFERWVPGIGLTGFLPFLVVMLGIMAATSILNTEFLKAIRAKHLGQNFDWTTVRYAAWGCVVGNVIMLYWLVVMAYITWFSDNPTNTLIQ